MFVLLLSRRTLASLWSPQASCILLDSKYVMEINFPLIDFGILILILYHISISFSYYLYYTLLHTLLYLKKTFC